MRGREAAAAVLGLVVAASSVAVLSPAVANDEVEALVVVRAALEDPHNVLDDWDAHSIDPCSWRMVICSGDRHVSTLALAGRNLSGKLSPAIGKLTNVRAVFLQNNTISGPIPEAIGWLKMLQTLDLSDNQLTGSIPSSLGDLKNLVYLELNNNSLSGVIPDSLVDATSLSLIDLSFNNLSGPTPAFLTRKFFIAGNPLICGINYGGSCASSSREPPFLPPDDTRTRPQDMIKGSHIAIMCGATASSVAIFIFGVGLLLWQYRNDRQIFVDDQYGPEECIGHLKWYVFKEIRAATDNFNPKNILGQGGFGIVYKGCFRDGTIVAVKRLKDFISTGEDQFHTEVEVISLVVHRNLLRLIGFCTTSNERLLVYPYMSNGTVASKLHEHVNGKPALDWSRRKRIALGTARGLLYLHEHCDPKIIHRDIKASNILLDEYFEAIVADFGLAKLLDQAESHVITAVRGTIGRIPPEYLLSGQSSEKTDVFGFGILLIELITGRKKLELGEEEYQKGGVLDWAKELLEVKQLSLMVDKNLSNNYDSVELKEMIQIALLCTMYNPAYRPKMSEVVRMLEGGGVAEKWESSKNVDTQKPILPELLVPRDYGDDECSIDLEAIELSGPR